MTKPSWANPICRTCWTERYPDRVPLHLTHAERETCAFCERETQDGIYVRVDPATVPHPRMVDE